MAPDVLIDGTFGAELKYGDITPLLTWDSGNPNALLDTMERIRNIFIATQLAAAVTSPCERFQQEVSIISAVKPQMSCILRNAGDYIALFVDIPIAQQPDTKSPVARILMTCTNTFQFKSMECTVLWPPLMKEDRSVSLQRFNPSNSALQYVLQLEDTIQEVLQRRNGSQIHREQFIREIVQSDFGKYLVEYDQESYSYLILYVMMTTQNDSLLGCALVQIHFTDLFPSKTPTVILKSPLFFSNAESHTPEERQIAYQFEEKAPPGQNLERLKFTLLNEMAAFQTYLVSRPPRK
ncbi:hypothetical protein EDD86DRAFT_200286 [Gorgonomyces haynaldii]|nr:hypothetical protein EDD86DRAFT_200286 [Gorgonomyces haynaldii]